MLNIKYENNNIKDVLDIIRKKGGKCISRKHSMRIKQEFRCKKGHVWITTFSSIKHGSWCTVCQNRNKKSTEFIQNYLNTERPGSKIISEYKNAKTKFKIICDKGHEFLIDWTHLQYGHWCKYCSGLDKKNIEHIQKYIDENHPGSKVLSTEYKNSKTKVDIVCEKNHVFKMHWNNIKNKIWCPYCLNKNEDECREIFEKITGKEFKSCKPKWLVNPETNGRMQLDGYNEELKLAFEYQGEQHYKVCCGFFGHHYTEKEISKIQNHDRLKIEICKTNNIKLIIIPYWENNKFEYIKKQLEVNGFL